MSDGDAPCYGCVHMRYGKDVDNSFRNALGFYVCVENPVIALILNDAAVATLKHTGCPKRKEKGVQ